MGAFGLQFTKEKTIQRPVEPQNHKMSGTFVSIDGEPDTRFQKVLAYSSYYTMVFATICAFRPELFAATVQTISR